MHARGGSGPTIARLAIAWLLSLAAAGAASAGCPPEPLRLTAAGFALAANAQALPGAASLAPLALPDAWRERRPGVGGFAWYRFALPAGEGGDERCAVLLPDVNMNAAVFVNGKWIGEGGSLEEPVAHNFNRPLYFTFPSALLAGRDDHVDVLLYAYPYHFERLGPVWVGPNRPLVSRYESVFFRQITLAQVGTAMAVVTILLVGVIWIGSGFQRLYGFFLASTTAWAANSCNYWVSSIPVSHWAWDRLVNGALDQFAVFLALFFHRLVRIERPRLERALVAFAVVAALAAIFTPRPWFATTMQWTHATITVIGAYVTLLAWTYRERLTRLEARFYFGAWLLQLLFSLHDLGIQFGLWRGSATRSRTPCRA